MNCMKCGRKVSEDQAFCENCLAEMEKYPVKPGTVIQLPHRREEPAGKRVHIRRKAAPAPEEQVKRLKKVVRRLIAAVVLLLVLLAVTGYFAVTHLLESQAVFLPGQNYSTMDSSEPADGE